ncbi:MULTISPECIES: ImmA/IrrE family metallo-endopeptidase [unclassified Sinorhizobium]|uniref:ImmA/IrrE family metallo-endopeptidase n=1 Tax=unclassified Sinorhizobium TaxID=2613772 RepID=UPI0024C45288|nr:MULTISPECIES: ImmA/IrrE family metallo-endopeptidase [unclassified Sinorhizobium]MDK1378162.1 ImmA/IrrE family metallo-endopeptidase [Sinorhizobium sp. 6-70]MDK1479789.1 ImmA/IrrE family metallo-endopeptidase [Sinorhizobium sp. 6-117]
MALRHGFKAEANAWSRDLRREMGLSAQSAICTRRLCEYLELPLLKLSKVEANPAHLAYFLAGEGRKTFSAVTLSVGGRRWIIHNDAHDDGRQAANIAHEIAHALLNHPIPALFSDDGQRSHKADEEEAKWLGPALLISDEAALFIVSSGMSVSQAATFYGASREVVQMRVNVCAARRRVA